MMAVRMDSGSSMTLMVLESVSIRIIKLAPRLKVDGNHITVVASDKHSGAVGLRDRSSRPDRTWIPPRR